MHLARDAIEKFVRGGFTTMSGHQEGNLILSRDLPNEMFMGSFDLLVRVAIEVLPGGLFSGCGVSFSLGLGLLGDGLNVERPHPA